jgi:hypothetical protein
MMDSYSFISISLTFRFFVWRDLGVCCTVSADCYHI